MIPLYQSVESINFTFVDSPDISIENKFKMFMDIICNAMEFIFPIKTKVIDHVQNSFKLV